MGRDVHGAGECRAPRGADVPRGTGIELRLAVLLLRLRAEKTPIESRVRGRWQDRGAMQRIYPANHELSGSLGTSRCNVLVGNEAAGSLPGRSFYPLTPV